MLSSGLPLNVPSPKCIPMPNGVTVDSTRHGKFPAGQSELPQCIGKHVGGEPIPADIKSSTMHGIVIRSLQVEKNCRGMRLEWCGENERNRVARVRNDPSENNELTSSSSSPDPSTSSSCGGASVVVVIVVAIAASVEFTAIVLFNASFMIVALFGLENWSPCISWAGCCPFAAPPPPAPAEFTPIAPGIWPAKIRIHIVLVIIW